MAPPNDLSNLDIDEVSPVRRGAIGKVWAFLKSNDEGDLELSKATVDAMGTPVDGEDVLVADFEKDGLDGEAIEANIVVARLKSLLEKAKKPATPTDAELNDNDQGDPSDNKETAATLAKDSEDKAPDPNAPIAKSADDVGGNANEAKERVMADGLTGLVQKDDGSWDTSGVTDPAAKSFYENVLKSLDDAKAESATLSESVKKAEADNAELKDKLVVKEITAAVESDYSKIAKADDLVPVLKAAKDALPAEQYEALEGILKSANAQIETGDLFKELGRSADSVIKDAVVKGLNLVSNDGDAWDTIVEKANAMVLKDGEDLTEEQRVDRFLKTDDGQRLYADYRAEHGAVA